MVPDVICEQLEDEVYVCHPRGIKIDVDSVRDFRRIVNLRDQFFSHLLPTSISSTIQDLNGSSTTPRKAAKIIKKATDGIVTIHSRHISLLLGHNTGVFNNWNIISFK